MNRMAKSKTTDANVEPSAVSEKKRSLSPGKAKVTAAATHKRTARTPKVVAPAYIPAENEIARLAYSYWEARGCQGGSPADDWFRAERELREFPQNR